MTKEPRETLEYKAQQVSKQVMKFINILINPIYATQALEFRVKRARSERLVLPAQRGQLDYKETRERQELAVYQDQQGHKEIREMLDPQPQQEKMALLAPLDQRGQLAPQDL